MITAVTAYVPIPGHPRSEEEYRTFGRRLVDANIPLMFLEDTLEECWLHNYLLWRQKGFTHSIADNPDKNSVAYHIVQAQKSEWLVDASVAEPNADVLVWIDYGIFHVPGVTEQVIQEFLSRAVDERTIAIPGCWGKNYTYDDQHPCWRFCGGVIVVPRRYVVQFDLAMKREYIRWLDRTNNLSWEINTLARVEQSDPELPLWWYKADHDVSMFAAYRSGDQARLH